LSSFVQTLDQGCGTFCHHGPHELCIIADSGDIKCSRGPQVPHPCTRYLYWCLCVETLEHRKRPVD